MYASPSRNQPVWNTGVFTLAVLVMGIRPAGAGRFSYPPIVEPIVSATFSGDFAALVAHRTVAGVEMNFTQLYDPAAPTTVVDLSDDLFGTAAWPAPAKVSQGDLETGRVSAEIPASFYPVLASGEVGVAFRYTDTDDAMFAIDCLILQVRTASRPLLIDLYGWPQGDENNGFGIGLEDGEDLPAALPGPLPVGATGTGFDETISSKSEPIPEPGALVLLLGGAAAASGRQRR